MTKRDLLALILTSPRFNNVFLQYMPTVLGSVLEKAISLEILPVALVAVDSPFYVELDGFQPKLFLDVARLREFDGKGFNAQGGIDKYLDRLVEYKEYKKVDRDHFLDLC